MGTFSGVDFIPPSPTDSPPLNTTIERVGFLRKHNSLSVVFVFLWSLFSLSFCRGGYRKREWNQGGTEKKVLFRVVLDEMKRDTLLPGREIQKESSFRPTASEGGREGGYPPQGRNSRRDVSSFLSQGVIRGRSHLIRVQGGNPDKRMDSHEVASHSPACHPLPHDAILYPNPRHHTSILPPLNPNPNAKTTP